MSQAVSLIRRGVLHSIEFMCRSWSQIAWIWIWNGLRTSCLRSSSLEAMAERKIFIQVIYWRWSLQWNLEECRKQAKTGDKLGKDKCSNGASPQPELTGRSGANMIPWSLEVRRLGHCISTASVSHCFQAIQAFGTDWGQFSREGYNSELLATNHHGG